MSCKSITNIQIAIYCCLIVDIYTRDIYKNVLRANHYCKRLRYWRQNIESLNCIKGDMTFTEVTPALKSVSPKICKIGFFINCNRYHKVGREHYIECWKLNIAYGDSITLVIRDLRSHVPAPYRNQGFEVLRNFNIGSQERRNYLWLRARNLLNSTY